MTSPRRCVHSELLVGNAAVFGHSFEITIRPGSRNAFSSKAGCRADRFVWFSWVIASMRSVKISFYVVKKTDTFCLVSAPWALCWKAGDDSLKAKNRCKKTSESQGPTEVCVKASGLSQRARRRATAPRPRRPKPRRRAVPGSGEGIGALP